MPEVTPPLGLYGIAAAFETPEALLEAVRAARRAGYRRIHAYTPFPVEGIAEAIGFRINWLPPIVALAGFGGGAGAYWIMWFASVRSYPLNVAGRPLHSWPSFLPITFEMSVLAASLTAIGALLLFCGLPCPYHPIFNAPGFTRLGRGRFVLCIETQDTVFDLRRTRHFLEEAGAQEVHDVPNA